MINLLGCSRDNFIKLLKLMNYKVKKGEKENGRISKRKGKERRKRKGEESKRKWKRREEEKGGGVEKA